MKATTSKHFLTPAVSLLFLLAAASPVSAFKIDFLTTFVPFANISHAGQPVHEEITRDAITNVMPAASQALIVNLQRGVQNADIIHQFDSESHFDNCSVRLNLGFSNGFATMNRRFASARPNALGNPEFLAPHYMSFLDISTDVVAALGALATDPECLLQPACPTSRAAADAIVVSSLLPSLAVNPNPDTHRTSNPHSLFHYPPDPNCQGNGFGLCGYLGPIQEAYLNVMGIVEDAVTRALGDHFDPSCLCDRNLTQVLGRSNSHVVQLQRLKNAIRAYHAHEELGHALHAAQDFFAHTDYVELMAGVGVGQAIPAGITIPLPTDFSQFNLSGLQALMGATRFNRLESGEVLTIWLGDGDFSLGDAGIQNFFNPSTGIEIGGIDLFGLNIPPVMVSSGGQNANPFPGFSHGHYLSSTTLGLNKDSPPASSTDEPAHLNFLFARRAAVQMSAMMWTAFLQSIGEIAMPIQLTCPAGKVVSTDPGQCYATGVALGTPSFSGGCEAPLLANNAPTQFVKGTNLVCWTATDSCGNSATCLQVVVVVDRELPVILCSTNPTVAATNRSGAVVVFPTPSASDNCPGVWIVCIPPSASTFPIGTNTVRCTASDAANNRAACNFTIRVKGAAEQVRDLTALVVSLHLPRKAEDSLTSPLQSALRALSDGGKGDADKPLRMFIDKVNDLPRKQLMEAQSRLLVAAANQIQAVIKHVPNNK